MSCYRVGSWSRPECRRLRTARRLSSLPIPPAIHGRRATTSRSHPAPPQARGQASGADQPGKAAAQAHKPGGVVRPVQRAASLVGTISLDARRGGDPRLGTIPVVGGARFTPKRRAEYSRGARDQMFAATSTEFAPWQVADSNSEKRARLNVITHLLEQIPTRPHRGSPSCSRSARSEAGIPSPTTTVCPFGRSTESRDADAPTLSGWNAVAGPSGSWESPCSGDAAPGTRCNT
jgi:hypothetical protein